MAPESLRASCRHIHGQQDSLGLRNQLPAVAMVVRSTHQQGSCRGRREGWLGLLSFCLGAAAAALWQQLTRDIRAATSSERDMRCQLEAANPVMVLFSGVGVSILMMGISAIRSLQCSSAGGLELPCWCQVVHV